MWQQTNFMKQWCVIKQSCNNGVSLMDFTSVSANWLTQAVLYLFSFFLLSKHSIQVKAWACGWLGSLLLKVFGVSVLQVAVTYKEHLKPIAVCLTMRCPNLYWLNIPYWLADSKFDSVPIPDQKLQLRHRTTAGAGAAATKHTWNTGLAQTPYLLSSFMYAPHLCVSKNT
jgi:hypothetical protein